ncbi:MAG: hypothetical protein KC464_17110, partial [Myxococcales bacterium]|nr:hypothetical protein [Myxococcales bacterium]
LGVLVVAVGLLLGVLGVARPARADDFFSSSPGPLSSSHASIDGQDHCNDCHTGGRDLSNDKCLGCHDHSDLKARIDSRKGFHASAQVRGKQCESCHNEHKGRGYDIMGWRSVKGGQSGFDHDVTGWKLEGKHGAIDCKDCHKRTDQQGLRVFLGEDRLCGSCHKKDQPHGFERREMLACERCHGQSVWKPHKSRMEFDHDDKRDAAMPLQGSHADVSCAKCHPKALFNLKPAKPDDCANCHDSPHDNHLFGKKDCGWCHSPSYKSLDSYKFDHDRKTKFDLGAHKKLACYDCHTKKLGERKPDRSCEGCHAKDSKHGDRFKEFGDPPACGACHPSSTWKPTAFNHDKKTRFKLTGRHAEVECRACHRGKSPSDFERFDAKRVGCMGCHQHKNVHDGQWKDSQCTNCHKGAGQIELTKKSTEMYHGPKSRFPLVKSHKFVKCVQCHPKDSYKDTPMECGVRCHEDSLHKGSLGQTCTACHSPGMWDAVRFDHTDDTDWPLKGLHKKVPQCTDCHPKRQYAETPRNCSAEGCHAKDDAHKGRLGNKCERCHLETGDNQFNHNTMSRYKLEGKHLTVRCSDCHPSISFKPRPVNCYGCHPEPDIHKGQYGTLCEQCHSTKGFEDIQPLHDVGDFSLKGAHDNLPCERCHRDDRPMQGTGNLCINCHRQDDVHSNSLSPRCGECHTQWSFTPARFDHTTVGCNLTGLHRAMPCTDCHKSGNFGALVPTCVSCHRDEAIRKDAAHQGYTTCATCHNPNSWLPAGAGVGTYGRESVCR